MKYVLMLIVAWALLAPLNPVNSQSGGPFSGITKKEYVELKEQMKRELEASSAEKSSKDWGDCRDNCYNERNRCLADENNEGYWCDAQYQSCVEWCDEYY